MRGLSLKTILAADALCCGAMGVLLIAAAGPMEGLTGLPEALSRWAGVLLLPVAALIGWAARMSPPPRALLGLIVAGNAGWIVASLALPMVTSLTGIGLAFVLVQAAAVAVLTLGEAGGMARRPALA